MCSTEVRCSSRPAGGAAAEASFPSARSRVSTSPTAGGPACSGFARCGDYDVDGATSAALLTILLRRLGVEPMIYSPDRLMEGYGPSGSALVELKGRGASLAITVDCGAQAFEALQEAADAGLEVIV